MQERRIIIGLGVVVFGRRLCCELSVVLDDVRCVFVVR